MRDTKQKNKTLSGKGAAGTYFTLRQGKRASRNKMGEGHSLKERFKSGMREGEIAQASKNLCNGSFLSKGTEPKVLTRRRKV